MRPACAVLIGGPPATGKSTLAAALARRMRAAVLDLDVATGPLTAVVSELIGRADLSDPELAALTRRPRYETLFALAEDSLRAGTSVILVAPFSAERSLAGWAAVTDRLPASAVLIWLHLPPAELLERLSRRGAARDAEKVRDPAAFLATLDQTPPQAPHLALDARMRAADLADEVVTELTCLGVAIDGTA